MVPPQVATIVVRFASRAFGGEEPLKGAAWSSSELWDESSLQELCALLVDALEGNYDGVVAAVSVPAVLQGSDDDDTLSRADLFPTILRHSSPLKIALPAIRDAFKTSIPSQLSAAHMFHVLLILVDRERSVSLRRAALLAISALCRALPPDLLASFLPGLTSGLTRLLASCRLVQASVVVSALDAIVALVMQTFPEDAPVRNGQAASPSFADALAKLSMQPSRSAVKSHTMVKDRSSDSWERRTEPRLKDLLVSRDETWIKRNSEELSRRIYFCLESRDGALSHGNFRVRLSVSRFAGLFLASRPVLHLDEPACSILRLTLFEACGDEYPVVRSSAIRIVLNLKRNGKLSLREIESGFRAAAALATESGNRDRQVDPSDVNNKRTETTGEHFGGNSMYNQPNQPDERTLKNVMSQRQTEDVFRVCDGYIHVLMPMHEYRGWWDSNAMSGDHVALSLSRIGTDVVCRLLVAMLEYFWVVSDGVCGSSIPELDNRALDIAHELGEAGLDSMLCPFLYSIVSVKETELAADAKAAEARRHVRELLPALKHRAYALLLWQAVVRGAVARDVPEDDLPRNVSHLRESSRELLNEISSLNFLCREQDVQRMPYVNDDTMISLKRCLIHCSGLLIESLSWKHEKCVSKPIGSDIPLTMLISLLTDVSSAEEVVRKAAHYTLRKVAEVMKCDSIRKLVFRHLNFVMSRLIHDLDSEWSGKVLGFIIGDEADGVSREATALLERSIRDVNDSMAGAGDSNVIRSLAVIHNVLLAASKQSEVKCTSYHGSLIAEGGDIESDGHVSSPNLPTNLTRLHRKLFHYCTDEFAGVEEFADSAHADSLPHENTNYEEVNAEPKLFESLAEDTLVGMQDLLVGRSWNVRASALSCAAEAVRLLKGNQSLLLPHAAKILPLLPEQFEVLHTRLSSSPQPLKRAKKRKIVNGEEAEEIQELVDYFNGKGAELPVVKNACHLLSAFGQCAGSFIKDRFVRLIFPKMRPLLRLAGYFPSLALPLKEINAGTEVAPPSYGAMLAADACLEALASIARNLPTALAAHAPTLVRYAATYFRNWQNLDTVRGATGFSNRSMMRYENERLERRIRWAQAITESQVAVNPGAVMLGLLCRDRALRVNLRSSSEVHNILLTNSL